MSTPTFESFCLSPDQLEIMRAFAEYISDHVEPDNDGITSDVIAPPNCGLIAFTASGKQVFFEVLSDERILIFGLLIEGGHVYQITNAQPYTRKDGRDSVRLNLEGRCVECGASFRITSSSQPVRGINRRCQQHKRPGKKA